MRSNTWIAIGAVSVLALLAFITLRAPERGEQRGPKDRPIPAMKAADVKSLELTSNGGKDAVSLQFDGTNWRLVKPVKYLAEQQMAKTAVEQLEKLQFGDLVTEQKDRFAKFEVSDDQGAHVVAKDGAGKTVWDGWIGKSVAGFTMIRPAGPFAKDQVWQATGLYKSSYGRDAKSWRDKAIFSFNKEDVSKLAVEWNAQKIELEKAAGPASGEKEKDKPAETHWKVLSSTAKVEPLDETVPNQMVQSLSSLAAADFDDAAKAADVGLATPRFKITVTTKGQPMVLLIGKEKGEDNWVQVEGKPQVYLMHKYALERLTQKPADFRDKTIVKIKEDEIAAIDITVGGEKTAIEKDGANWKFGAAAKADKKELDPGKARSLASGFEDFKGSSFAESTDAAQTGLAKPSGEVTLHLKSKSTVVIKVGATKDGADDYVQKVGSPDVLMVKKYLADRFLKKTADLVKSDAPKGPPGGMPPGMRLPPGMQMPQNMPE